MFPYEICGGLPPIRGIEHQIDFVLGVAIRLYLIGQLIEVTQKRLKNSKGKWMS